MKKIMFALLAMVTALLQTAGAQNRNVSPQLSPILTQYYSVKEALTNNDAAAAAARSGKLAKTIQDITISALPAAEQAAFEPLSGKLLTSAQTIAGANDLNKQRDAFKTLSDDLTILVKAVPLSAGPVYQQYCPMKKAYWLSDNNTIKNPYYGKQMLTCGKVTGTIE
ncbi:Protein of unknown function [Chitinophaga terrae (ex Kim and Jung 2007)]|uniref:DUF3347 domain-containing protein n=1 Tax=Chitinophaga terrae (ex Kim and Jung 2007) TaxID=408074 RepID=A0A1H3ZDM6_9BACT|nr:DUF3347 domain-containing protein [Chitinophaga terrae (ex Kim and Jung 2007)]GEP88699.1 hypothetical protein CTE07_03440 [Chitinophaga terrae (ex Kim and Jung 2007)]SEA21735.1 Protein of unknown function [Chitinophaga terrae (ex Kim and Jung 2007)]